MKKVLITGYNGLIGSDLVNKLISDPSLQIYGLGRSQDERIDVCVADLGKGFSEDVLPEKMDIIIHLAQSEKFREFPEQASDVFNVNTLSTLLLLKYAVKAGVKNFIYASSGGVYGGATGDLHESIPLVSSGDLGFYLTTKFCSELLVENYTQFFDVNILRFFFVYGPGQKREMLIPRLMNSVMNGNVIKLQGKDGLRINPVFVSDASSSIVNLLDKTGSSIFNIAGAEVLSLRNICDLIGEVVGREPVYEVNAAESPKNLIADINKMKSALGTPLVSVKEGLEKLHASM